MEVAAPVQQVWGALLRLASQEGLPFALWRLPDAQGPQAILSLSPLQPLQAELEQLGTGLLLGGFASEQRQAYWMPADLRFVDGRLECAPGLDASSRLRWEQLRPRFEALLTQQAGRIDYAVGLTLPQETSRAHYEQMVRRGIAAIRQGRFQKVVPAKVRKAALHPAFDPLQAYAQLLEKYPRAFVSLVSAPEVGTWMGATPETLLRVQQGRYFSTVSLAGTQPYRGQALQDVTWGTKEIEEQALVSRYIVNCFKKIRLREFEEQGPSTLRAGNLLHLCTSFQVDMQQAAFPDLASVMLELLHPTSAVCGMPKPEALSFLQAEEGFDRQLFSGFLGPVHWQGDTQLFVNLRCMQLSHTHAYLYAGAGITADSVPEKEWTETEMKTMTVGAVL